MNPPATARLTAARAADLARGSAVALLGLLVSIAAILGWRRAAGAIATPLDLAGLLSAALLVATCAAGARLAWLSAAGGASAGPRRAASRVDRALAALVSLVVLAIGLLVCLPGTTVASRLVLWIILTAEELFTWRLVVLSSGTRRREDAETPGTVSRGATAGSSNSDEAVTGGDATRLDSDVGRIGNPSNEQRIDNPSSKEGDLTDGLPIRPAGKPKPFLAPPLGPGVPGGEVLQQLTRSRTADGGELLSGWLRVDLAAGQRTANLHVAFCPPFARAPRVSVQQVGGPEARVKTAQTLPYGVRFDLKVADEGSEASILLLQFAARVAGEGG
jgi:hypothetical protein